MLFCNQKDSREIEMESPFRLYTAIWHVMQIYHYYYVKRFHEIKIGMLYEDSVMETCVCVPCMELYPHDFFNCE